MYSPAFRMYLPAFHHACVCRHGWKCNPNEAFPTVDQVCEWSGVTCANNQVVAISIGNMGVEGTLSPWLGTLLHLVNLNIYGNYIKGIAHRVHACIRVSKVSGLIWQARFLWSWAD